jgi:beta-phosphoglucomutase-like phosphatase (HAD superfamily)
MSGNHDSQRLQLGADTIIGSATQVLLMDCFETLVQFVDDSYVARLGIGAFLDHFVTKRGLPLAVVSDAEESALARALREAGLWTRVDACFHAGNASQTLPDGRSRKRLDLVLQYYRLAPEHAVFIGDSPLDARDAQHYRIPFIRVPRSEDRAFTFQSLIAGPSRYASGHFSSLMLNDLLGKKP